MQTITKHNKNRRYNILQTNWKQKYNHSDNTHAKTQHTNVLPTKTFLKTKNIFDNQSGASNQELDSIRLVELISGGTGMSHHWRVTRGDDSVAMTITVIDYHRTEHQSDPTNIDVSTSVDRNSHTHVTAYYA